jgi:PAS domain S-box-containing protein
MNNALNRGPRAKLEEMMRLITSLPGWLRRLGYYGLALLFVATAATLRWELRDALSPTPILVFYLAWVGAAAFGGLGPGLLATVASWLCVDLLFDTTFGQIDFTGPAAEGRLLVLLVGGLVVSIVGEKMRRTRVRERRQAQELAVANAALGESERRLSLAQQIAHVGTFDWDIRTGVNLWTPEMEAIYGLPPGGFAKSQPAWEQLVHPEDQAEALHIVEQAFETGKPTEGEWRVVWPDGSVHWLAGRWQVFKDESGKPLRMTGVNIDITERKQTERALRERMKELGCLYAVSRDLQEDLSVEELCRRAVTHLVPALQFPEITVPVIELNGKRFTSKNYAEGLSDGLQAEIRGEGEVLGHLRVCYARERPFIIPEEQNLVNGVAEALSTWLVRQRAEEALRESEEKYRRIVETATEGIVMADTEARMVFVNDRWSEIFGYSLEEAGHITIFDLVFPEDRARMAERWQSRKRGVKESYEFRFRRKDGSPIWALIGAAPRLDPKGKFLGTLVMVTDITERKRAEEALRQSERQFKSTFENAAIGIAHVALDGRILQPNSRFCEIAGYSCEDVLGKTCEEITFADDWEAERVQIQRLLEGEVAHYSTEKRYLRRDGRPVWVNLTRSIQRDDASKPEYFIVLVEDISERKRAEEALRELTATLESKVAQRTAEVRHRVRQLQKLTLDMSEAEDRERGRLAEILHDDLQQVLAAAKFQLGLLRSRARHDASLQTTAVQIDHLLKDAIGKSRSLSHELSPAVLHHDDFAETLRWLASQVQAKHGLVVHVHAHGPVRSQSEAIKAFLYRTAQEMLFNVVKHARVHEARMRVRQCDRCICLLVSDRGRGFDPRQLGEAAGFGLLSIRERIELLGGRMRIKSAEGKGSTFFIAVPAGTESQDTVGAGPRAYPTSATPGGHGGPPLRVLLADDHEIVRQGLVLLLSEEQTVEVVGEAANGREAVDLADRLKPDVVIMDVSMPLIDGNEATRQIKAHLPKTRVIALSMYDEPETIKTMYQAGAESYVLKTATSEELIAAIRAKSPTRGGIPRESEPLN